MQQKPATRYTVKTVDQAFELLEIIAGTSDSLCLPALSDRLRLSRNKTFRLLCTLQEKGLIDRDDFSGSFRTGIGAVELSQKIIAGSNLVNHAHPVMEELVRKHGEAVYMTVLKGDEIVFLDMVDCRQQIRAESLVGKRFPFFTNAAGKVLKALESRDLVEKVLRKRERAIPHAENLVSELTEIRERGVAVDNGGLGEGVMSVAVAVRDYAGRSVGALTLLGPSFRLLAERVENEIIPSLVQSASQLSRKFGYAPV